VLVHPLPQVEKVSLNCTKLTPAPGCDLTAVHYQYNGSGGVHQLFGVKTVPGAINSTAAAEPGSAVVRAQRLGLSSAIVKQPLLYLLGGTKCNILLPSPVIRGIKLPHYYNQSSDFNKTSLVSSRSTGRIYGIRLNKLMSAQR